MEDWKVCKTCDNKLPLTLFYLWDGNISDVCRWCNYGKTTTDSDDGEISISLFVPKEASQLIMELEKERCKSNMYKDKACIYPTPLFAKSQ